MQRVGMTALAVGMLALGSGCTETPVDCDASVQDCFDGGKLPDTCDSVEEALSKPECTLTLGTPLGPLPDGTLRYISFGGDKDYYSAQMPATLTARSLLTIRGGYTSPSTPVDFTINVLRPDGGSSIALATDSAPGAPVPVQLSFPFAESGTRIVLQVRDAEATNMPKFDVRNGYELLVDIKDDPDVNEPNNAPASATAIPLAASGPELMGSGVGYLSTTGDVDYFKFTVPMGGRKILYLSIKGPSPQLMPPPPYVLQYTLFDSTDKPVAEGTMLNQFLAIDLATARLLPGGEYTLKVNGKVVDNKAPAGDPRPEARYTVTARILDDLDTAEPNDNAAQGATRVQTLSLGQTQPFTSRLSYVPDAEWFAVDLPANSGATVLRYRLNRPTSAGRFTQLPGLEDRQVRVLTQVTGPGTADQNKARCRTDATVCPKGYDGDPGKVLLAESLCNNADGPLCIWAERNEYAQAANLNFRNMEGAIPVGPHGATVRYFFVVQDDGQNFADDKTFDLNVTWEGDADDTARLAFPEQTQSQSISTAASGVLTHGYGKFLDFEPDDGRGIRGPEDYDAVPTDIDRYEFTFPAGTTGSASWTLEWDVLNQTDGGSPAGAVAIELEFCNPNAPPQADGGICRDIGRRLAYQSGRLAPWYSGALQARVEQWSRSATGGGVTITSLAPGCFCFQPNFTAAGRYNARVVAVDRVSNGVIPWRLRQTIGAYPTSYAGDGGTLSCPVPCGF